MRFGVLGPVEARVDVGGEPVALPAKPRLLLAVLLLHAGRPVSRDRLMAALWAERPPPSAPRVLRTYVSALRQSLYLSRRDQLPRLALLGDGYRLEMSPGDLDLLVFDDLAERGRRALNNGDAAAAARLLGQALGLWRGQPAEDVTVDGETGVVLAGLAERRLLAEEDRGEAELILGHHAALIARLRSLVAAHPLRERLSGQLMTALYQIGQQAAALAAYRQLRTHLTAELGVEPSPGLRDLHQRILAGDVLPAPQSAAVAAPVVPPRQLPPDVSHFTGRAVELDQLDAMVGASGADQPTTVVITAISGTAGVGKTALAIHWAHRIADRFPDGQLYASLRGHAATGPADPPEILARFLRALGVAPDRVPGDPEEAAAMYRSLLDGRRVLIVLDNAASSGQVRPLLPGAPGCAVIVTSRGGLPGLGARDGAARVTLTPFLPAEAAELLRRILGSRRADAEPSAVATIATECAFLPLALRIAAERAIARPHQTLAALAAQLTAARDRLDVLEADDDPATSVRTVLSWSYQALPPDMARMFRLLGLHPGPDIGVPAAAALTATSRAAAQQLMEALGDVHLLGEAAGRYRFHDLLRAYAAERARGESPQSQVSAIGRLLTWYLHTAEAAVQFLQPGRRPASLGQPPPFCAPLTFLGYDQALAWLDAEHASLVACVRQAAESGHDDIAWKLCISLWGYFPLRQSWTDWIACSEIGLAAARHAGDRLGEAWVLRCLGSAHRWAGRPGEALGYLRQSLTITQAIADRTGESSTWNSLGAAYGDMRRLEESAECIRHALVLDRESGDRYRIGLTLANLGEVYQLQERPEAALDCHLESLRLVQEVGLRQDEAMILSSLGDTYRTLGKLAAAREQYEKAVAVRRKAGDRHGEAETLRRLGDFLDATGEPGAARQSWHQALAIFEELHDPRVGELHDRLRVS